MSLGIIDSDYLDVSSHDLTSQYNFRNFFSPDAPKGLAMTKFGNAR